MSSIFLSNTKLKLAKNQAKVEQQPESEFLSGSKKNVQENKCVCLMRLFD